VISLLLYDMVTGVRFQAEANIFLTFVIWSGSDTFHWLGTSSLFLGEGGVKLPEIKAETPFPAVVWIENEWSYASTPQHLHFVMRN
jgi:hypothetical protein